MDTPWRIELFGGLRAQRGEQALTRFRTQKTALLLAYLAYYGRRTHSRETLIELLWPESDAELGRHNLSVALSWLRNHLEPPSAAGTIFLTDRFTIGLNSAAVVTDVAEFEAALASAAETKDGAEQLRLLIRAVDLYRGPLLAGHYEDWIGPEQQRWEELFFHTLRQLIAQLAQAGTFDHALQYALRAVSTDPLREEAHREVMRLYTALDQPAAALRQYHELKRLLKQELGETPSDATRQLAEEIQRGGVGPGSAGVPPASVSDSQAGQGSRRATGPSGGTRSQEHPRPHAPSGALEPVGGAVPLNSPFYVARDIDGEFQAAITRGDSIVLIKGSRQVGKTSLLARGLQQARVAGARVVRTDFRAFNAVDLHSAEALLRAVGETIGEQLDLDVMPANIWQPQRGPNPNFRRYLQRQVLETDSTPLVWGLDEVDRLFDCDFGPEIFALFRSWHNDRALDPTGPWGRLTLAIAYATEAHLFITDLNQSPFNVGTRLTLEDFTPLQVAELNLRYSAPLNTDAEVARYYQLVGGHPYLVRRGLHEMATHGIGIADLETRAVTGDWIFGDHLRHLLSLLTRDPDLCAATRELLHGRPCPTAESFYRLRSAGVIIGDSEREARPRCHLYTTFLQRHLP